VRALSSHLGHRLDDSDVSALVYRTEEVFHGTPSGIDNTVVAHERAVYFQRGKEISVLRVARPFCLLIADTGVAGLTRETVADVRAAWERDRCHYEDLFAQIGATVDRARVALETGDVARLGPLMDVNQELLRRLDVSSPEIERLVHTALDAGAEGAKLSGGGRGGNVLVVTQPADAESVRSALLAAGAAHVIVTPVE
jgi:mevalonate kinase